MASAAVNTLCIQDASAHMQAVCVLPLAAAANCQHCLGSTHTDNGPAFAAVPQFLSHHFPAADHTAVCILSQHLSTHPTISHMAAAAVARAALPMHWQRCCSLTALTSGHSSAL